MKTQNKTLAEYLKVIEEKQRIKELNKKYFEDLRAMGVLIIEEVTQ